VAVVALNARQSRFVLEYVIDFNGTRAAIRAGYSENGAHDTAYHLLSNAEVIAAVEERQEELAAAAGLTCEWVLRQWKQIAEADPNELISTRLECCRHCYGIDHQYQWTEVEYSQAIAAAAAHRCNKNCESPCSKTLAPRAAGGFGFSSLNPPVEECPACQGAGFVRVLVADTRKLRGPARRLYAGLKQTKDGIEIKMRNQDLARDNIAKYLGMLIDKRELAGPGGGPIPIDANFSAQDLTDDQLAKIVLQRAQSAVQ
jgi:phage terminase small subunit